jgi:hypothetical protein
VLFTTAGDHVPEIPFIEVFGSTGGVEPLQIGAIALNVGVTAGVTVKFNVANESQLVDETSVTVCEPAEANVNPFQL